MMKTIAITSASLLLSGCATQIDLGDLPLQYEATSSTLELADGLPQLPGDGSYFAVPGYVFVAGRMSFHPGTRRISYACPGDWDWERITHYVPQVEYTFQEGKRYELYCESGYPRIRLLGSSG